MTTEQQIVHPAVSESHGLVRLESAASEPINTYEIGLRKLIEATGGSVETLAGVQRPRSYTSYAMTQFAYAHAMPPGPGDKYPLAAVVPMNKTDAWWQMDFLHRESFFLPRYDANEEIVVKGHAMPPGPGDPSQRGDRGQGTRPSQRRWGARHQPPARPRSRRIWTGRGLRLRGLLRVRRGRRTHLSPSYGGAQGHRAESGMEVRGGRPRMVGPTGQGSGRIPGAGLSPY